MSEASLSPALAFTAVPESLLAACAAPGHRQGGTRAATEALWWVQDYSTSAGGVHHVREGQRSNSHLRTDGPRPDQQCCWGGSGRGTTLPWGGQHSGLHTGHPHISHSFHHHMPRDCGQAGKPHQSAPESPRDTQVASAGQDWHTWSLHSPDPSSSSPCQALTNPNCRKLQQTALLEVPIHHLQK